MVITQATRTDLEALVSLFAAYRAFYGQPHDEAAARVFLADRIDNSESVIFIARQGSCTLGFTQLYPCFSSVNASRIWLLNDLYVDENARRQGVGAALLDAARHHGEATGASSLMLQTTTDNAAAQALYEKHGWVRQQDFYWYDLPLEQKPKDTSVRDDSTH